MNRRALFVSLILLCAPAVVTAAASTNYRVDESTIGGGGLTNSSSANFKADGNTVSGTTVSGGNGTASASASYRSTGGVASTPDPSLTFQIGSTSVSLGALSTSVAATGMSSFNVKNYTSSGYIVQVYGAAPTSGSHALTALSPKAASQTGTEQFGINLVANTSPIALGASPTQVPSSGFSYGVAEPGDTNNTGYAKPNYYRYVSGETIAKSQTTSGETDYTISYLANAATTTPAGSYTTNLQLICVATF